MKKPYLVILAAFAALAVSFNSSYAVTAPPPAPPEECAAQWANYQGVIPAYDEAKFNHKSKAKFDSTLWQAYQDAQAELEYWYGLYIACVVENTNLTEAQARQMYPLHF